MNNKNSSVVTFKCIGFDKKQLKNVTIASKMQEESKINSKLMPNQVITFYIIWSKII